MVQFKKLLLFVSASLFLFSCENTPEDPMDASVYDYMKEKHEGEKYEPVSFGEPDTVFLKLENDPEYIKLEDELIRLEADRDKAKIYMRISDTSNPAEKAEMQQNLDNLTKRFEEKEQEFENYKESFKTRPAKYILTHVYKKGDKEDSVTIVLDSTYNVVKEKQPE